jgi:hypothetical protein
MTIKKLSTIFLSRNFYNCHYGMAFRLGQVFYGFRKNILIKK